MRKDIGGWQVALDEAWISRNTAAGYWRNETVADLARKMAAEDPDRVTHVFDGAEHSIGSLLADAERLAGSLHERGLRAGDVVSFQLPNWPEAMVINLAASILGLVVAPIVPIYRDAEAAFMLADCRAKIAFVPGVYRGFDYLGMMRRLDPQLPALQTIASVRVDPQDPDSFEALVAEGAPLVEPPRVDPNAVKLLLYTSGTTGRPKAVLHSHNTMAYTVRAAYQHWGHSPGDTMLMASPVTHITGYGSGLELPLLSGIRVIFMERWNAAEALDLIDRWSVATSIGATPFLQELLTEAEARQRRLPSLRTYACGGAAVPPGLIRKASEVLANCRAFRVFGSSEVPLVTLGFVGEGQLDLSAETDGEIVHYEVKIVGDDGEILPPGRDGEICARGAAMFLGYADPEQTRASLDAEGYFRTGDLGHVTPERAIVITGRSKDLINRGGEKISAKEIEDILHRHPAIEEAAIVSMPHDRLGETVCAYVVARPGRTLDFADMVAHVAAAGVARQKLPERLELIEAFPRTPSGKIRKDQLRREIASRLEAERGG